jgi:hypothetical protein
MKRVIGWIGSIFARRASSALDDQADDLGTVNDEFSVEPPSRAEVAASMKGQKLADDDYAATVPQIEILESDLPNENDSNGYDPYNRE